MTRPIYLGDLTDRDRLEATVDAITNLAVEGAQDFLVGPAQLGFLAEMPGLSEQDKGVWYRFEAGDPVPTLGLRGLVADPGGLGAWLGEDPGRFEGRAVAIDGGDGPEIAALACELKEAGATEVLGWVRAETPGDLLTRAVALREAAGVPLALELRPPDDPAGLEACSLALGFLLEREWVGSLTLGGLAGTAGPGYGKSLLNALELKRFGINYVSCPTCGRCRVDLEAIVSEVKARTKDVTAPMTVAIMGCEVNGPGEARHADIGIASGTESGLLIQDGEAVAKYREDQLVDVLVGEIHRRAEAMEV